MTAVLLLLLQTKRMVVVEVEEGVVCIALEDLL